MPAPMVLIDRATLVWLLANYREELDEETIETIRDAIDAADREHQGDRGQ